MKPTMEELLGALFSVQFVTRLYKEGQLPLEKSHEMAVTRVGDSRDSEV
jgi:hypothetical protein